MASLNSLGLREGVDSRSDSTGEGERSGEGGGGYIGMCRCEGYGFQTVHSRKGYTNQSI